MRAWWRLAAASPFKKYSPSNDNESLGHGTGRARATVRNMAKQLQVTLVRSTATRPHFHRKIVEALGLRRLHHTRLIPDNAAMRGMIAKIPHMLEWKEVQEGASS
ncbi:MAG: 50S ribosomal protein L30 [bacterium]|nr:50S ribosomal protein L30 [bacterium]MBK8128603.1 50S ribosomal protein L30 [bacterium]